MCRAYRGARIRNYREKIECELEVVEYVIFRQAWIELRYVKAPRFSTSNLTWLADSSRRRSPRRPKMEVLEGELAPTS
ncbi:MAG: hypothetical protein DMF42_07215 [Verrucomicrobia bacterium]|nr:MAG: hypothetical protein DMF42_07215 [Verrucomicrobiota bacterium]